ncbi:leucine Rich repeat-containing domain protein [Dictyocaulus viviparus]|uniref:Leucine Rich repeat-containing domain protein n=1 Tax=Dictyocaulus viviparus TaxID=29172 RepID=A0A0D8YC10_DICVI|nr:leucine Rich repeat-containing domain protein [Dictyocaulus viviparus]
MIAKVILVLISVFSIVHQCPTVCQCHSNGRVDCSGRGLGSVPADIPTSTTSLDLRGNLIDELSGTSFIGLEDHLVQIDLSKNNLRNIDSQTFENLKKLRTLRFNLISSLSVDDVIVLSKCRSVDLSRNFIKEWPKIDEKFNNQTPIIERLDLTSNLLSSLHTGIFSDLFTLQSLRLSRNKIEFIESHAFHRIDSMSSIDLSRNLIRSISSLAFHNLRTLTNLSLSRNEISRFDDGVFFGCDSLKRLNLSRNHIRTISDEWLFGLNNLHQLDLSYNQIASVDANAWKQCSNLRWLSLHHNQIQFLPSGAFRLLTQLEFLGLSGNSIESFHKTAMTGLDQLNELDLSSNSLAVCLEDNAMLYNTSMPFLKSLKFRNNQLRVIPSRFLDTSSLLCDCHLAWFPSWFVASKLSRRNVYTRCAHPTPLSGIDVFAIDADNLTCVDDSPRARILEHPATSVSTLVGEQARFSCSGYGLAPIHVEWRVVENGRPRTLVPDATTIMNVNHSVVVNGTINGHELVDAELLLLDVSTSDRAEYQCVVRNQFAAEHSVRSVLKIFQVPVFSHEPDDMSLLVGQNAKIMCAATGIPPPVIKWSKDGGAAFPAAIEHRLFVRPNDDHLYVVNVTKEDQEEITCFAVYYLDNSKNASKYDNSLKHQEGVYTCHAVNEAGSIQASATLRIFENTLNVTMKDTMLYVNETLLLDCYADLSHPSQRMEWTFNSQPVLVDGERVSLKAHGQILAIKKIQISDSGEYACELWAGNDQLARQSAIIMITDDGGEKIMQELSPQRTFHYQPTSLLLFLILTIIIIFAMTSCSMGFGRVWNNRKVMDRPEPL